MNRALQVVGLLIATCAIVAAELEEMRKLEEVPRAYRTDINLFPIQLKGTPKLEDSVSIGTIGSNFVTFHGRKLDVAFVQVGEDLDKNFVQVVTKSTAHGGWSFIIVQGKPDGKPTNWCYLTISYSPRNLAEDGTTEVYGMLFGKKQSSKKAD